MDYKITKEQILETIRTGTDVTERYFKEIIPDAFKTELEVGRWYKVIDKEGRLYLFNHQDNSKSYGFFRNEWSSPSENWNTSSGFDSTPMPATDKEVKEALIAEAKKRGFKKGIKLLPLPFCSREIDTEEEVYTYRPKVSSDISNRLQLNGTGIYQDGIWSEILPEEKTVITKEKALKILAKKYGVSPEQIEINP